MKRCRLKPSSSSHQTNTLQHKRTPPFKKNPISTFRSTLRGLFTSASSPSRMRTKPRFQQETIKKLFLVETPPRRRHALRCQKFTKSRRKVLSSSSIDSHTSTDVVSPKRTAYSMPAVAALWRSPAGQAPTIPSTNDSTLDFMQIDVVTPSTLCSEADPDVDDFTDVAKRNPINPKIAITESSQQLNHLVDLRREAYRDLALSTQTYNDALVLRMRHLESLSWEDQRSWVQGLGDSNSFAGMVGAEFCNWNGDLGNDGTVVVVGDDDVDELIDLMNGDAGNVKDYEELLEFERGIMKHDVDEANWVGDLW